MGRQKCRGSRRSYLASIPIVFFIVYSQPVPSMTRVTTCHDKWNMPVSFIWHHYPDKISLNNISMSLLSETSLFSGKLVRNYSVDFTDIKAVMTEDPSSLVLVIPDNFNSITITCTPDVTSMASISLPPAFIHR